MPPKKIEVFVGIDAHHRTNMEPITYYSLNQAQHFSFPHDNADTYTDEQLWFHYIGHEYLCVYLIRQLGHKGPVQPILDTLVELPSFKEYAVAWMRLKFLCEVMEPTQILRKRNPAWQKPNSPMMKEPCLEIWSWTQESLFERYYKIDVVANRLGQHLFDTVKAVTLGGVVPLAAAELGEATIKFNKNLYEVRGQPLNVGVVNMQWSQWNPKDLLPYAWALYLIQAWTAFSVFLPLLDV